MTERIVVIGAGHNGLACAATLAKAGREVLVLEAAPRVGGAAVTREFAPGFQVSAGAHLLYALDPALRADLGLDGHGLALAKADLATVALGEAGEPLVLAGADVVAGSLPDADRAALAAFWPRLCRLAALMGRQHDRAPPRLGWDGLAGAWPAARLALDIRRLGRDDMRELLRIASSNVYDVLDEQFTSPRLKGALALDAVLGTRAGPRSGNTVLSLLYRLSVAVATRPGAAALPKGGMGTVSAAFAAAARAAGAEVRTGAPVAAITLAGDRVAGVRLADGEEIAAAAVVSGADPRTTFLRLLGARHLEAGFAKRVHNLRASGTAAKLHLALDGLPAFRGLAPALAGERIVIAPDMDYVERAFNPCKYGEYSPEPVLEVSVPTVHDPALAPAGRHVLSAVVQYAPRDVREGSREQFLEATLAVLERHAPGLRGQVLATELLLPEDLERQFGMSGGHWHHAELALDQYLLLRPVPGAARYATPVPGLWLCGAGCHPGGGVMGHAGRNAARALLAGEDRP